MVKWWFDMDLMMWFKASTIPVGMAVLWWLVKTFPLPVLWFGPWAASMAILMYLGGDEGFDGFVIYVGLGLILYVPLIGFYIYFDII